MANPELRWTLSEFGEAEDLLRDPELDPKLRSDLEQAVLRYRDHLSSTDPTSSVAGREEMAAEPPAMDPVALETQHTAPLGDMGIAAPRPELAAIRDLPTTYWGGDRPEAAGIREIGISPYMHQEPPLEEVDAALQQLSTVVGSPEEQAELELAFNDLQKRGKQSTFYRNYADERWKTVHDTFRKHGHPVVRADQAEVELRPWEEGFATPENWATATGRLGSMIGEPLLAGADMGVSLGLGREALSTVSGNRGFGGNAAAALDELEQAGVIPSRSGRIQQGMAEHPVLAGLGMLRSFSWPGASAAVTKPLAAIDASTAAALRSTGLPRLAQAALRGTELAGTGAAANVAFGTGERAITELGEAVRGEGAEPEEILGGVPLDAAMGGIAGIAAPMAFGGAMAWRNKRRARSGIGGNLMALEDAGGRSALTLEGVKPSSQAEKWLERAPQERRAGIREQPQDLATHELTETGLQLAEADQVARIQQMEKENTAFYKMHGGKPKPAHNTFRALWNVVDRRSGAMGDPGRKFERSLKRFTDLKAVVGDDAAAAAVMRAGNGRVMSQEQAAALGFGDEVGAAIERLSMEDPAALASQGQIKIVVVPRQQTIDQLEEGIEGLNREIRYDTERGPSDPALEELGAASRADREQLFGKDWADAKRRHSEDLGELEQAAMAVTGSKSFEGALKNHYGRAFQAFARLGQAGNPDRRLVHQYFERFPEFKDLLMQSEGLRAYQRLTVQPGSNVPDVGYQAGVYARQRVPLWADAVLSGPARHAGLGGSLGLLGGATTQEPPVPDFVSQMGDDSVRLYKIFLEEAANLQEPMP